MESLTTFGANTALGLLFTTGSTQPSSWFIAMHTADPGAEGVDNEVTTLIDADYTRQSIAFDAPSSKQTKNTNEITFTPATGTTLYDVPYLSIWDASTGGNCIAKAPMQVVRSINDVNPLVLTIGDIVESLS